MAKQRLELTWYNKDKALIPTETGKYGYTWVAPSDPRYCETHTLVMDEYISGVQSPKSDEFEYSDRADLEPQTDNLMILGESGDVLEALTRVPELADKYVGKVKLVYIDPPFNTAQTFASYEDNLEHSVWLTMMRDRLLHLRKLLADDGSIWVHLDDAENHRMRLLLDEVFGASNFVIEMQWNKKYGASNNSHQIASMTDSILVFRKTSLFQPNRLPRTASMNARYSNPDGDPLGAWKTADATARHNVSKQQHPSVYGIQNPFTGHMQYPSSGANWYFQRETVKELLAHWGEYEDGDFTEDERLQREQIEGPNVAIRPDIRPLVLKNWTPALGERNLQRYRTEPLPKFTPTPTDGVLLKVYLSEVAGRVPVNLLMHQEVGHNDSAKKEIAVLFPNLKPFSTPKPERLLERILEIGTKPGDLVLDIFGGSATTAAVAQKMGRRWVTCELLESTFTTYTRPRLEKVINDQDPGGITRSVGERIAADGVELPDGVSPEDAAKFTSVLNKLIADDPDAKKDPRVKALKAAAKTLRTKDVINWRGGGGFQVAHLSPTCFDVDEDLGQVVLTEAATGDVLVESVAANLGFRLLHPDDDIVFEGRRGRTLLKVYEGVVDAESAASWLSELEDGETLLIAALGVADGVNKELRRFGRGCRAIVIPDDLFTFNAGGED